MLAVHRLSLLTSKGVKIDITIVSHQGYLLLPKAGGERSSGGRKILQAHQKDD
nr:MAG TPA: hypothetical protein [Caudoviricetes sp.]